MKFLNCLNHLSKIRKYLLCKKKWISLFFILLFPIYADETVKKANKYNLLFYGGKYTETDLLPILFSQKTDYRNSFIGVVGINYPLSYKIRFLDFEAEALFVKHFGIMNHWESDILTLARISNHRSGVFGLFCPPDPACGSNFISYGIKFSY